MTKHWIVLGGGGHSKVVIDTILSLGRRVIGFTSPSSGVDSILDVDYLGGDAVINDYDPKDVILANGLGSISATATRAEIFRHFASKGYNFETLVHPSAVLGRAVDMGSGTQVMAGVVLQPNCRLGENVLVNTGASIDHDCHIECHVHIAPGATISGGVIIGEGSHVGTGANVLQGVHIGAQCVIGGGALVHRDVAPGVTVTGIPARPREI